MAAPFLVVRFAPLSDLPQQVAQVRLFLEAVSGQETAYRVQWLSPNLLSYVLLGSCWALFSPLDTGRLAMLCIGLIWVCSLHALARERSRSPAAATLATILFFNHIVYWGFYNFALGFPVFVLWFLLLSRMREPLRLRDGALLAATAYLLYASHALWFAGGMVWLVARQILFRPPIRTALFQLTSVFPAALLAALWYPRLTQSGFTSAPYWGALPWERISSGWLVEAAMGGLRGWLEPTLLAAMAGWLLLAAFQRRRTLRSQVDRELLAAGLLFLLFSLLLPYKLTNTIQFAERWHPIGLTLILLAFPVPAIAAWLRSGLAAALIVLLCSYTAVQWRRVEAMQLSGLSQAIEALPPAPKVMGLDFVKQSPLLAVRRPFLQTFAYAQVVKGGRLNFSFADFGSSLVVFDPRRDIPWAGGLEWDPERARLSDLPYFSHLLVGGEARHHQVFSARPELEVVTSEGIWRLYAVRTSAGTMPRPPPHPVR